MGRRLFPPLILLMSMIARARVSSLFASVINENQCIDFFIFFERESELPLTRFMVTDLIRCWNEKVTFVTFFCRLDFGFWMIMWMRTCPSLSCFLRLLSKNTCLIDPLDFIVYSLLWLILLSRRSIEYHILRVQQWDEWVVKPESYICWFPFSNGIKWAL